MIHSLLAASTAVRAESPGLEFDRAVSTGSTCNGARCRADRPVADLSAVLEKLASERINSSGLRLRLSTSSLRLNARALDRLILVCAPTTPADVVHGIVLTESGGHLLRMATNGSVRQVFSPPDLESARRTLTALMARGANVDIGLMQLNSATLARLHVAPAEALDPCRNLSLGAQIFDRAYAAALARREPTALLWSASSIYNTGNAVLGLHNGYAERVRANLRALAIGGGG